MLLFLELLLNIFQPKGEFQQSLGVGQLPFE